MGKRFVRSSAAREDVGELHPRLDVGRVLLQNRRQMADSFPMTSLVGEDHTEAELRLRVLGRGPDDPLELFLGAGDVTQLEQRDAEPLP